MIERKGVEEVRAEQAKLAESYRQCFRSPAGTAVLDDLKKTYMGGSAFVASCPHSTSYNIGMQDLVSSIVDMVEAGETNIEQIGEE